MVRWLRGLVVPAVLVALIGLAGLVLSRVYADDLATRLVLGAAAGSVLVSVSARRLPSWLVAPLSVFALAGYTALAMWLAARHTELPGGLAEITLDAARNGIPRLLTAMIPVEPTPDTVVVPLVAAWLAGLAGSEVALRTGRVLLSYLPAGALYAGVLYVVGPNADRAIWPTVAFAAAAAVGLAVSTRPADVAGAAADLPPGVRASLRLRRTAGATAGLAAVIALAALAAPVLGGRGGAPVDPRRYVEPPVVDTLDESPLIRISGWALRPDQSLFEISSRRGDGDAPAGAVSPPPGGPGDGDPADGDPAEGEQQPEGPGSNTPLRIRLAVLNDYDGVTWRVGATYRNAGRTLPSPPVSPSATVDTVHQQITIDGLSGQLLPAVATPRQVTGARVAYDGASGTLIRPEGLAPGVRYDVESVRERPDPNLLSTANVPAGDAVARVLAVPDGTPDQLRSLAEQLANDNGAPYERAAALEQFLAEHYRMVADAPSGHAYPNLRFFLFGPRNGGGQKGTSEQFAAAYAVLGRMMGLPTRVVVGFSSPTGNGPVRAGDASAWPEVLFEDLGWVAFDPLPKPNTQPRPVEEDFKPKPEPPPPTPEEEPSSAEPGPSATGAAAPGAAPRRGVPAPVLAGGGAGGMLVLVAATLLVLTLLRRAQTRRRLAEGSPADRVAGAWREVTDALRLAGRPAGADLAASEVAAHAHAVATAPTARHGARRGRGDRTDPRLRPASPGDPAPPNSPPGPGGPSASGDPPGPGGPSASGGPPGPGLDRLATLVNRSAFAPEQTDEEHARQAAADALAYASALRERRSWWRRLWWSAHPGPLRWRRGHTAVD